MADRNPDVIERMVIHHWNTLFHESGPSWANVTSEKCRQQQTDAMLAAVRDVLWDEIIESGIDGNWEAADWLRDHVIKPATPPDEWPNVPARAMGKGREDWGKVSSSYPRRSEGKGE